MINKIRQKIKRFASAAFATITVTASVSALVSCSKNTDAIDDFDREMGISSATYERTKRQFRDAYRRLLEKKFTPPEELESKMQELEDELSSYDEVLNERTANGEHTCNYSSVIHALSKVAVNKYGVKLSHDCKAKISDLTESYRGLRSSLEIQMRNHELDEPTISRLLSESDHRYDTTLQELMEEYNDDPFMVVINGRPKLLECFQEASIDAAFMGASQRLGDFLSKYTFEFNDAEGVANHYDEIKDLFHKGDKIDDDAMNLIFKCTNIETNKPTTFKANETCPGYVLCPIFDHFEVNNYSNMYSMYFDWTICPSVYYGTEKAALTTAHLYGKNEKIQNGELGEEGNITKIIREYSEIQLTSYSILPTPKFEAENLKDTYFNKNSNEWLDFAWNANPAAKENKQEYLWEGIGTNKFEGDLKMDSLAYSGLKVSITSGAFTPLIEIIKRIDEENKLSEDSRRADDQLSLAEKFVRYCDMEGHIKHDNYNSMNAEPYSHVKLGYCYKNHQFSQDSVYVEASERNVTGFSPSVEFFTKLNDNFNNCYEMVTVYEVDGFDELYTHVKRFEADVIVTLSWDVVQIGIYVVKLVFFSMLPTSTIWIYCMVITTSLVAIGSAEFGIFYATLFGPFNTFHSNLKKMNKQEIRMYDSIAKKVLADASMFALRDKNGKVNQSEFDKKRGRAATWNFATKTRPLYQYYTALNQNEEFQEFYTETKKFEVDPTTFRKKFMEHDVLGKYKITTWALWAVRFGLGYWVLYWQPFDIERLLIEQSISFIFTKSLTACIDNHAFKCGMDPLVPHDA